MLNITFLQTYKSRFISEAAFSYLKLGNVMVPSAVESHSEMLTNIGQCIE
jgi:hypothetical protein